MDAAQRIIAKALAESKDYRGFRAVPSFGESRQGIRGGVEVYGPEGLVAVVHVRPKPKNRILRVFKLGGQPQIEYLERHKQLKRILKNALYAGGANPSASRQRPGKLLPLDQNPKYNFAGHA